MEMEKKSSKEVHPVRIIYEGAPENAGEAKMEGTLPDLLAGVTILLIQISIKMEKEGMGPAEQHIDFSCDTAKQAIGAGRRLAGKLGVNFLGAMARTRKEEKEDLK